MMIRTLVLGVIVLSSFLTARAQKSLGEDALREYYITNIHRLNSIEGIWKIVPRNINGLYSLKDHAGYLAVVKKNPEDITGKSFIAYSLEQGRVITAAADFSFINRMLNEYIITINESGRTHYHEGQFILSEGQDVISITLKSKGPDKSVLPSNISGIFSDLSIDLVRIFPTQSERKQYIKSALNNKESTGVLVRTATAFAISPSGLIATAYHVIQNAVSIKVYGINGDFTKGYSFRLIKYNETHDIAILKVNNSDFGGFGNIPYSICRAPADVGTEIFVLGYPLTATMGEEIKLTTGIISAASGFQGNTNSYQITAPIQPGNSGAPLFNTKGELVGIVNAKHSDADNVGYAIKSKYFYEMAESLSADMNCDPSRLNGKPLTSQVKILKQFVYILEVNY